MKTHTTLLVTGLALAPLGLANAAPVPANVLINPDGGGAQPAISVQGLDWAQSSILTVDNVPLDANLPFPQTPFQALTQASLGGFQNPAGVDLPGTGLNSAYEWTTVMSFYEETTNAIDADNSGIAEIATFATRPDMDSVLQIFYDDNPLTRADPLLGTGFNNGTLILEAVLTNTAQGVFQITESAGAVLLDQNGVDDWAGQQTLQGQGSTGNLDWSVTAVDNAFFPQVFTGSVISLDLLFGSVSQQTPFNQVDPARQLWDPIAGAFNTSDIGVTNLGLDGGPDGLFQTDYNSTFLAEAPEPGSLALLGLGLAVLGGRTLRRTRKAAV